MKIAGTIQALILADIHMREVLHGCELLGQLGTDTKPELRDCIFTGVVICYARSFGQNDGLSSVPRRLRTIPDPVLSHTHAVLLELRDKRYAHHSQVYEPQNFDFPASSDTFRSVRLRIDGDGRLSSDVLRENFPADWMGRVVTLAEFQRARIGEEIRSLVKYIVDKHGVQPGEYIVGRNFPPPEAEPEKQS